MPAEDTSFAPSTHIGQHITLVNHSSHPGSNILCWIPQVPTLTQMHTILKLFNES
ncbi:rCG55334 [Rattus norvegicus]|uniref:RCG55334 n=1 Tax=Rattus norvegicus TaxID=10116 RepID=A6KF45_RAT|nr:rCG55334 [Rattus norvegicus]